MEIFYWICVFIIFYVFIGYGLVISLMARLKPQKAIEDLSDEDLPSPKKTESTGKVEKALRTDAQGKVLSESPSMGATTGRIKSEGRGSDGNKAEMSVQSPSTIVVDGAKSELTTKAKSQANSETRIIGTHQRQASREEHRHIKL